MSAQEQRVIAQQILKSLYDAWEQHTIISLDPVQEEGGWDKNAFRTAVEKLEKQYGLIKNYGSSYTFEITPDGILYSEENKIVSEATAEKHRKIRTHILTYLSDFYDREGSLEDEHWEKIAEGASVDEHDVLIDLYLLTELDDIEAASTSSFRITDKGLRSYRGADYEDII
ncbi:MAG: hypothetical protein QOE33_1057 [Acidobacteriota bacterium]|nr:hypothetical protein [Acidobacteriota bacterium]